MARKTLPELIDSLIASGPPIFAGDALAAGSRASEPAVAQRVMGLRPSL